MAGNVVFDFEKIKPYCKVRVINGKNYFGD